MSLSFDARPARAGTGTAIIDYKSPVDHVVPLGDDQKKT
jgi:hypothetical protein